MFTPSPSALRFRPRRTSRRRSTSCARRRTRPESAVPGSGRKSLPYRSVRQSLPRAGKPPIHLVFKLIQPGIKRISFQQIRFKSLCCPNAKPCRHVRVHTIANRNDRIEIVKVNLTSHAPRGVNKKCKVRIAAHTAILKFDRRVALRSAMPAAFLCRQCIPASLHRAATSVLQADSIMPDPM